MDIRNQKLSEAEFFRERNEVLKQWPTGKDVDLDEAIAFHKSLPPHKVFVKKLHHAREHGDIYAVTGMGKATIEEQIELLRYVEKEGKAELLGTSVDSISRQNNYQDVERGITESIRKGRSVLNGVPVVNHGVAGIRKIFAAVNCPIALRYGAADPRLIDEIGFAGGHTAGATDTLMDFWHHSAKIPLETALLTHRYTQRLVGYYEEHGVPICASCQGLYGAGIPPSLQMAAIIVQTLMMAEQGVRHTRLHFAAHGNLTQDVATARVLHNLNHEYLLKYGYPEMEEFLSVSFSLMQYPQEAGLAFAVIFMNTLIAKLCGTATNDIRTVAEAKGIPAKEDIACSVRTARAIQNFLQNQKIEIDKSELDIEMTMVEREVRSIVDRVLELGNGDAMVGTVKAMPSGILDNPFAANSASLGKVIGVKDSEGAIRYLDHGNLPFTRDILEFHKAKIAAREMKTGKKTNYETIISDLMAVSKGVLVE